MPITKNMTIAINRHVTATIGCNIIIGCFIAYSSYPLTTHFLCCIKIQKLTKNVVYVNN